MPHNEAKEPNDDNQGGYPPSLLDDIARMVAQVLVRLDIISGPSRSRPYKARDEPTPSAPSIVRATTRATTKEVSKMRVQTSPSEDLAHGQVVIVTTRWILILAGLLLSFWNPDPDKINQLRVTVVVILALAVANFYLHAQLLMRRPAMDPIVYAASAADLAVISLLVIVQGGFSSNLFIFYYLAFLAFSVAFSTSMTIIYAGSAMVLYWLISLSAAMASESDLQVLIARLIMLAAVAICGNLYWRIEGDRRRAAVETREELTAQIEADRRQAAGEAGEESPAQTRQPRRRPRSEA